MVGWPAFAAANGGLAISESLVAAGACMLVVAVAYGIAEPAERALVAALSADGRQGAAFGR